MLVCARRLQWCMGHRLVGHEGKCAMLHGHNYVGLFEAQAPDLDDVGRVIDFAVLKEKIGGWIDVHWDHGFLLNVEDDHGIAYMNRAMQEGAQGQKFAVMPYNPTAENIATYLIERICPALFEDDPVDVVRITIWETENCYAVAEVGR